jgi:hypothetical protein
MNKHQRMIIVAKIFHAYLNRYLARLDETKTADARGLMQLLWVELANLKAKETNP